MKIILALSLCIFLGFSTFAQSEKSENGAEKTGVEEISLARDDGSGNPGAAAANFNTSDIPIYCLIQLASVKAVTVKMNLVAVVAPGLKPGKIVVAVVYKTDGKQRGVTFNAAPEKNWTAGKYRVDILLDGKPAKSLDFEIQKSPKEIEREKLTPPKPKSPAKAKQKTRKN
ncbi:MAG TPA: hypothetical protein VNI84_08425 [Pyrinomonadaceae bacterium]|nr:hypothetical protein [Pyrinomonadaceae bacterium]